MAASRPRASPLHDTEVYGGSATSRSSRCRSAMQARGRTRPGLPLLPLNVEEVRPLQLPSSQTCIELPHQVKKDSPLLAPVRTSYRTATRCNGSGSTRRPTSFFNHSIHVNRGVKLCGVPRQDQRNGDGLHAKPSAWVLHRVAIRDPAHVREKGDVFNLDSQTRSPRSRRRPGAALSTHWNINPRKAAPVASDETQISPSCTV